MIRRIQFCQIGKTKQTFIIDLLGRKLESANIKVIHAKGDADTLIIKEALQLATSEEIVLVGEDTDLFILLLYHTSVSHILFRLFIQ